MNRFWREIKKFKNDVHMHERTTSDIARFYGISDDMVVKHLYPAIGRKTRKVLAEERHALIMADPLFGERGKRAPCTHLELAEKYDIGRSGISGLRIKHGIRPSDPRFDKMVGKARLGRPPGRYSGLLPWEISRQKLCLMTRSWGRPAGMDAHLESLK